MNNSSRLLNGLRNLSVAGNRSLHISNNLASEGGLFTRVFGDNVAKATQSHSVLLANQQCLYNLQIHHVKPEYIDDYEKYCEEYMPTLKDKGVKVTGSWRSEIGDLDKYVHLSQYKNHEDYAEVYNKLKEDKENQEFIKKVNKVITHRESQLCLSFSFWGEPVPRNEPHIYEMRSYSLKPGTLIEWGNNWGRGIRNRLDYCVAGMFTQVGPLFKVHHIWAYKSLEDRKEAREKMWEKPGWDECVSYTVPLIRRMESKIMVGMPYSSMK